MTRQGLVPFRFRKFPVYADAVVKAGADQFQPVEREAVESLGKIRHQTHALAYIGQHFHMAALARQPAADNASGGHELVPGQQAQQGGLARAVGSGDLPVLALVQAPGDVVQYLVAVNVNRHVFQSQQDAAVALYAGRLSPRRAAGAAKTAGGASCRRPLLT